MRLMLPPCVKSVLELPEEDLKNYVAIVGAYFKSYARTPNDILSTVPSDLIPIVWKAYKDPKTPRFNCDLVKSTNAELCNPSMCPLMAGEDPVEFLVSKIASAVYDLETRDITIWFEDIDEPLVFNAKEAYKNPSEVRAEIAVYTLEHFGSSILLTTIKDEDGNKINLIKEFVDRVYTIATKRKGSDAMGIGELLLGIVNNHPITPKELASVNSEVFVYESRDGRKYLAIEPRLFKTKAKSHLGVSSQQKLIRVLRKHGIEKRRLRIKGELGYFYLVPKETIEMFTGMDFDEILNPRVEDIFSKMMDNHGGENEKSG